MPWFTGWTFTSSLQGRHDLRRAREPWMVVSGVLLYDGHLPYGPAVPGSHRATSCDLWGDPYGRTECRGYMGRPNRVPG